jgi:hypothetical protein
VCLAAVRSHAYALKYVPEAQRTAEMCLAAIMAWAAADFHAAALTEFMEYVPKEILTPEFCLEVVLAARKAGEGE